MLGFWRCGPARGRVGWMPETASCVLCCSCRVAIRHAQIATLSCPAATLSTGTEGKVVLENVELPGWLFQGEQAAPEVEAAVAVVAAEQEAAPPAQPEEPSQQAEEAAEPQQSQQAEAVVDEPPQAVADAAEVEPAAEQEQQAEQAAEAMNPGGLGWC